MGKRCEINTAVENKEQKIANGSEAPESVMDITSVSFTLKLSNFYGTMSDLFEYQSGTEADCSHINLKSRIVAWSQNPTGATAIIFPLESTGATNINL